MTERARSARWSPSSLVAALVALTTARVPAAPLGVARVLVGLATLSQWKITPGLYRRYSDPTLIHFPIVSWLPGPSTETAPFILVVWLVAALCFTVGWRTRWAGAVLAPLLLWNVLYDEQTYDNHTYLLSIVVFLVTLADGGAALSVDARRGAGRATVPAWGAFLVKAQLSVVYGFACINKLNAFYLEGGIMIQGVKPLRAMEPLMGYRPVLALAIVLAWSSVLIEGWIAVAMWRAKWRPSAIALGFLLHAGINSTMGQFYGLLAFTLAMWAMYLPFLDARPGSRVVVWDERCSACTTVMRWLRRLDWMEVHDFRSRHSAAASASVPPPGSEGDAVELQAPDGRHTGFGAVSRVLELEPLSFLWAPLLRLAPVRRWGDRVYRRYAIPHGDRSRQP